MFKKSNHSASGRQTSSMGSDNNSKIGSRTSHPSSTARKNKTKSLSLKSGGDAGSGGGGRRRRRSTNSYTGSAIEYTNNPKNSLNGAGQGISDGSLGSLTASTRSSTATKHVRFSNVKIREFERIITNNPSCSSGAPIGLGWGYEREKSIEVDEYESKKSLIRKNQTQLVLSRQERESILLEWGFSVHEIVDAIRCNVRAKHQRRHSVYSLGRYDRWEEMMQKARRRLRRTILLQKPSGQRAKELSAQVQPCWHSPVAKEDMAGGTDEERCSEESHHYQQQTHQQQQHLHSSDACPFQSNHPQAASSDQHLASVGTSSPHHPVYTQEEYLMGMSDPGVYEQSATDDDVPAPFTETAAGRRESMSWNGGAVLLHHPFHHHYPLPFTPHPSLFMGSPPVFEVNLCRDVSEISSHLSYDYDDDATTIYSMQDELDDYDDDGFGQLVRDTRHWYVDGLDAPHPERRMIPTIIYEDSYYYHPYHQQHYYDNEMMVVEDHPAMEDYGVDPVDPVWQAPPPQQQQQQSRQEQQQQPPVVILGQPRCWRPPEYG